MLTLFRRVALIEGITNVALFFVAMPVKYLFGNPSLVPAVGMAPGIAWLIYLATMVVVFWSRAVPITGWLRTILAGLVPLGTFFNDRYLKTLDGRSDGNMPKAPS